MTCCLAFLLAGGVVTSSLSADEPMKYEWPGNEGRQYAVEVRSLTDNTWLIQKFTLDLRTKNVADSLATLYVGMSSSRTSDEPVAVNERTGRILQGFPQVGPLRFVTSPEQKPSSAVVDVDGRSAIRETNELPYLLGYLSEMLFDHLPELDQKEWSHKRTGSLLTPSFTSLPANPLPFTVDSRYRLSDVSESHATIIREYRLFTDELRNGEPHIELQATKTSRFDRESGTVTDVTVEGRLSVRENRLQVHYPVRLEAHLLSSEEKAKMIADAKKARLDAAERAAARAAEAQKEFTSEERTQVLKQLELGEDDVLDLLSRKRPAKPDVEISEALVRLSKTDNGSRKDSVFAALEWWGDTNSVPVLIEALNDTENYFVPQRARAAVVRLRAKEAIPVLIAQVKGKRSLRRYAAKALAEMGSMVEESVLPLLSDEDEEVHRAAIEILGGAGTSESLAQLKKMAETADVSHAFYLKQAITQIEKRAKEDK
jgi:hypothetical protein